MSRSSDASISENPSIGMAWNHLKGEGPFVRLIPLKLYGLRVKSISFQHSKINLSTKSSVLLQDFGRILPLSDVLGLHSLSADHPLLFMEAVLRCGLITIKIVVI